MRIFTHTLDSKYNKMQCNVESSNALCVLILQDITVSSEHISYLNGHYLNIMMCGCTVPCRQRAGKLMFPKYATMSHKQQ